MVTKDVKTGFLTEPVIGLLKPVIYRLPDYVTSHVAWLIVGFKPNISIWGALHSKTGRVSCICDWLRDATGLDSGDWSWICNAALYSLSAFGTERLTSRTAACVKSGGGAGETPPSIA